MLSLFLPQNPNPNLDKRGAGKKRLLGDGLMIYDWCFVGEGAQVALSTGTVHGMTSRHLALYDVRSGRLLQEWNGDPDATSPIWAKDLKQ